MARTAEKSSSDPNPPPSTPPSRTDGTPTASTSSSSSYLSSTLMVIALCIGALACSSKYIGALQTSGVPFPSGLLSPSSWRDFQWLESLSSYLMPCSFNPYATPTSKLKQKKQKLPKEAVIPPKVNARHVTAAELAKHGATSRRIWISLLGHVYDVTTGPKHYGPQGGYAFFSGKDGSRAFYTGEFNQEGLIDDISDFAPDAMHGLWDWVKFYDEHDTYEFVGILVGSKFFDENGQETPLLQRSRVMAQEYINGLEKARKEDWTQYFPKCNMEWSEAKGSRVWCDDPNNYPRRTYVDFNGKREDRCICESHTGFNSDSRRLYPGCSHDANSCSFHKLDD